MLLNNNLIGIIIATLYIFIIIGLAELLRKWRGYSSNFTRKVIHIGVGMMSWALIFVFTSPWPFIIMCMLFAVLLYLDFRFGFFPAMASKDKNNMGTVYFPIAAAATVFVFWDQPPLMVAALMPLTWGDGLAPVVGRAYGKRPYYIKNHKRTVEGSLGFFVFGFVFTWLALWLMPGLPEVAPVAAILPASTVMVLTTMVEAVSLWGIDNLTITAVAILILSVWPF